MAKSEKTESKPAEEPDIRKEAEAEAEAELSQELDQEVQEEIRAKEDALREAVKEDLKAKKREEIKAKLIAEAEEQAQKRYQEDLKAEVEREVEAEERAKLKLATSKKWKTSPKLEMRRVFRVENPPMREGLVTLMTLSGIVNGTTVEARTISLDPNHAQQYVLPEGAIEYDKQLEAMRKYEALGLVLEVAPDLEGAPWVPPRQREIQRLEAELKKLKSMKE